ncbi:hypothetical protein CAC42_6956 [Sphaceloma murrayae]|uniref:Uncharacterized protein n=1 Tax=Sphaceloma murrayae TaxID=2082308 RepID=A0A2K1QQY0_9PEZI|nr:hypothetical protein CAC42_6956 [Sphaceloma murrayae]
MSYGQLLEVLLKNAMSTILFSAVKAPEWLLPNSLKELKIARGAFIKHIEAKIEGQERAAFKNEKSKIQENHLRDMLVGSLLSTNEKAKVGGGRGSRVILSDEELYGNLFMYNLGGFKRTSTQLTYTLPLLAVNPAP